MKYKILENVVMATNERERESAICWVRDTEKIIKSNKIKKPKGKRRLSLSV